MQVEAVDFILDMHLCAGRQTIAEGSLSRDDQASFMIYLRRKPIRDVSMIRVINSE